MGNFELVAIEKQVFKVWVLVGSSEKLFYKRKKEFKRQKIW